MKFLALPMLTLLLFFNKLDAQCTMHTIFADSFEYTTPCTDAIPNTSYTIVPQAYQTHLGTLSLYLNFINYNASTNTGTNAGDTVYVKSVGICPNVPFQTSAWLRTTFSGGTPCNMRLMVVDKNNVVLADTATFALPYPTWFQYQSGLLLATTDSVKFIMITNVPGGNGNDLSFDEFIIEQCSDMISATSETDTSTCNSNTININAPNGFANYFWNDSTTSQSIAIVNNSSASDTVAYFVTYKDSLGCAFVDTFTIYFEYCTDVNAIENANYDVTIFPNPTSNTININWVGKNENANFQITNTLGEIVLQQNITNSSSSISLQPYANGFYFVKVFLGNEVLRVFKVQKM